MEAVDTPDTAQMAPQLMAVADAAGARLRAEVDGDESAATASSHALLEAATAAMNAGFSLTEITQAESGGKAEVRAALQSDTLKHVERTGRLVRDARAQHHQSIARAVRLGLSTRQIAAAAGVTHGTVRAITNRLSSGGTVADVDADSPDVIDDEQPREEGQDHPHDEHHNGGGEWSPDEQSHEQHGEGGW